MQKKFFLSILFPPVCSSVPAKAADLKNWVVQIKDSEYIFYNCTQKYNYRKIKKT